MIYLLHLARKKWAYIYLLINHLHTIGAVKRMCVKYTRKRGLFAGVTYFNSNFFKVSVNKQAQIPGGGHGRLVPLKI